jgi:hypothetical protein
MLSVAIQFYRCGLQLTLMSLQPLMSLCAKITFSATTCHTTMASITSLTTHPALLLSRQPSPSSLRSIDVTSTFLSLQVYIFPTAATIMARRTLPLLLLLALLLPPLSHFLVRML